MVDVVGCRLFLFEKREYICVAQFGLVSLLSPYASRRGWDFLEEDKEKVASL